ncbi:MAG: prolipoprotein diacylglyceryl transferase, partial [Actinomycetia bacterium]|nr:prolipoprotein diacylglyceryl transferase [Actinomycetes bacterium]
GLIGSIIGARLFYIIINPSMYYWGPTANLLEIFKVWNGGLVYYGGFIGSVVGVTVFAHVNKMKYTDIWDIGSVGIPVGHLFGRLGCHLNGCCYGKTLPVSPAEAPWWAIVNHSPECAGPVAPWVLVPAQLLSVAGLFIIFWILLLIYKKFRKFPGIVFSSYFILYGIFRFFMEFLRNDYLDEDLVYNIFILLSLAQLTSIVMVLFGTGVMIYFYMRSKKEIEPVPGGYR